jgi:hypothetical protein
MGDKSTTDLERAERTSFHRRRILGSNTLSNGAAGAVQIKPTTDLSLGAGDTEQVDLEIANTGSETVYLCKNGETVGTPIEEGQVLREENVAVEDDLMQIHGDAAWGDVHLVYWSGDRS